MANKMPPKKPMRQAASPIALPPEANNELLKDMRERLDIVGADDLPAAASCTGITLLEDMQDRLALEGKELQRMEDESGLPLGRKQAAAANGYLEDSQKIATLLACCKEKKEE